MLSLLLSGFQACRQELEELRQQLLQLATATMRELREQVAGEAVAITGLPSEDCALLPAPVQAHIKVSSSRSRWDSEAASSENF